MADLVAQAKDVVQIFRSLCTSRKLAPTVRQLITEYKEIEGGYPPKCGYPSIEELMRASGEFDFVHMLGEIVVRAKPGGSEHISEMIKSQRNTSKRPKRANTVFRFI